MTTKQYDDDQLSDCAAYYEGFVDDSMLGNVATELLAARKRITQLEHNNIELFDSLVQHEVHIAELEAKLAAIAALPDDRSPTPTSHEGHVHEWCAGYRYAMRHVNNILGGAS